MSHVPQGIAPAVSPRWPGFAFAGTILLSAFLLFQVQPLISKFILPWFGGCPAVWTTCMLFPIVLFAGYSYAHLAGWPAVVAMAGHRPDSDLAGGRRPVADHSELKLETDRQRGPDVANPAVAGGDGGPALLVLSTTSPLLQVWFSRSYPGRSPYRLYALSNFGSLAALLSYPFVFEPVFDLPRQSWLWSGRSRLMCSYAGRARHGFGESARNFRLLKQPA